MKTKEPIQDVAVPVEVSMLPEKPELSKIKWVTTPKDPNSVFGFAGDSLEDK